MVNKPRTDGDEESEEIHDYSVWKILGGSAALATTIGLFINILLNFADLRSSVRDVQTELKVVSQRVADMDARGREADKATEARIKELDTNGTRQLVVTESKVQDMARDLETLKSSMADMTKVMNAHNNNIMELYRNNSNAGKK